MYSKEHPDFITITCLNWQYLLEDNHVKDIIVDSLQFLSDDQRVTVYAFVIMSNHMHLIWQMNGEHKRENVQRDFLKFTGQRIVRYFKRNDASILDKICVNAADRQYQVWERNSLSKPLWSGKFIYQKLAYIHNNPVAAGMCRDPEEYHYSSASFYHSGKTVWKFLVHIDG